MSSAHGSGSDLQQAVELRWSRAGYRCEARAMQNRQLHCCWTSALRQCSAAWMLTQAAQHRCDVARELVKSQTGL